MKSMFSLAVLLLAALATQAKTPPQAVLTAFQQKFPSIAKAHWEKEGNGEWEAEFDLGGAETSANFAADGKWLETETEIGFSDLPAPVQSALKGKKVKETAKIVKADGTMMFEAEVGHHDLMFDAAGKAM